MWLVTRTEQEPRWTSWSNMHPRVVPEYSFRTASLWSEKVEMVETLLEYSFFEKKSVFGSTEREGEKNGVEA